jgi:hypothetical protein
VAEVALANGAGLPHPNKVKVETNLSNSSLKELERIPRMTEEAMVAAQDAVLDTGEELAVEGEEQSQY